MVKGSFDLVSDKPEVVADFFYTRRFQLDVSLRPLVKGDMRRQGHFLMEMIATAVRSLDRLDDVVPAVQALCIRHAWCEVKDADYTTVGAALLWTLERGLRPKFMPEPNEAWTTTYNLLPPS